LSSANTIGRHCLLQPARFPSALCRPRRILGHELHGALAAVVRIARCVANVVVYKPPNRRKRHRTQSWRKRIRRPTGTRGNNLVPVHKWRENSIFVNQNKRKLKLAAHCPPYAQPDRSLRIRSVRDLIFMGYCRSVTEFEQAFSGFNRNQEAIYALHREQIGLTKNNWAACSTTTAAFVTR
jgi:hypothetical protein